MAGQLALRRRLFVEQYLIDYNGKQAAIRAGYSPHTAEVQASDLLRAPKVSAALERRMAQRAARMGLSQDRVLEEYRALAMSDVSHYTVDETGNLGLAPGAPDNALAAVSSIKRRTIVRRIGDDTETTYEVEFKLWDKPGALKLLAKHVGVKGALDRLEVTGKDGGPIEIEAMSAEEKRAKLMELATTVEARVIEATPVGREVGTDE